MVDKTDAVGIDVMELDPLCQLFVIMRFSGFYFFESLVLIKENHRAWHWLLFREIYSNRVEADRDFSSDDELASQLFFHLSSSEEFCFIYKDTEANRLVGIGLGISFLEEEEEPNIPSHPNIVLNIPLFDSMAVCSQCLDICNFPFN